MFSIKSIVTSLKRGREGEHLKTHQMCELRFQFEGGRLGRSAAHHQIFSLAVEKIAVHTTAVHPGASQYCCTRHLPSDLKHAPSHIENTLCIRVAVVIATIHKI